MDKKQYYREYNRRALRRYSLCLSKERDKDIIEAIDQAGEGKPQVGIKLLIREAISRRS